MTTTMVRPENILIGGVEVSLVKPERFEFPSQTDPARSYTMLTWPSAHGVETNCLCPSRKPCKHRRAFAALVATAVVGSVVEHDVSVRWAPRQPVIDQGPADPFEGL